MVEGTRIVQSDGMNPIQRVEIAALQRGQVETSSKLAATEGRLGAVESSLKVIQSMLQEALKAKGPTYDSDTHSHHAEIGENSLISNLPNTLNNRFWQKGVRAELPMFDGQGAEEWVFRVREYFEIYEVPNDFRMRMLSFHLTGFAYTWYRWVVNNQIMFTWESFLDALILRFGQNIYHDPKGALKELKQMNLVAEYQFHFEELSNQVTGLSEEWFISLFVAGLQEQLKCEVMLARPGSYVEAVSIAKLHEQKNLALQQAPKYQGNRNAPSYDNRGLSVTAPTSKTVTFKTGSIMSKATGTSHPVTSAGSNNVNSSMGGGNSQYKRLTIAEIKQRREKGLCYYCQ